jgi:hypothetical protein
MNSLDENKIMELTGGLKNALERGETLENAIQSLKNAGYNEGEVIEASKKLKIIREEEEKKQEQKTILKEKPKRNFLGLRKLFSRKPKTIIKKTNQQIINPKNIQVKTNTQIINREKINSKILPVRKPQEKPKRNFLGLRKLFSRKPKTIIKKTNQQIINPKNIPVKKHSKKPMSKRLIWIITIILSILILIGAAILGLYWGR